MLQRKETIINSLNASKETNEREQLKMSKQLSQSQNLIPIKSSGNLKTSDEEKEIE